MYGAESDGEILTLLLETAANVDMQMLGFD